MIEAAIVIPILLTLLIGAVYFGSLMYNQQRAYMASRHGAWLKTKAGARNIENEVKAFFAGPNNVEVRAEPARLQTGISFVDRMLSFFPVMEDNYKVKVTYRQPPMPYAAPVYLNPQDELVFSFQGSVTAKTAECTMPSRNTWKSTSQILRSILGI